MNKVARNACFRHILGPSVILIAYSIIPIFDRPFHIGYRMLDALFILLLYEIIVNIKYPEENFLKYYKMNAPGVLIFLAIATFLAKVGWRANDWWNWLLNYRGLLIVMVTPVVGYSIGKALRMKKYSIYIIHVLVPAGIGLVSQLGHRGYIPVAFLIPAIFIWQAYGSVGITMRNFWKFYLANILGLIIFIFIFSYRQDYSLSFLGWIDENRWLLEKAMLLSLVGLTAGLIIRAKPINDGQEVKEKSMASISKDEGHTISE